MNVIKYDKFSRTLSIGGDSKKLGVKDALVLDFLLSSGDKGAKKIDIINYAWNDVIVTDASLTKSISVLRGVFDALLPGVDVILTSPRVGYKIDSSVIAVVNSNESTVVNAPSVNKRSFVQHRSKLVKLSLFLLSSLLLFLSIKSIVVVGKIDKMNYKSNALSREQDGDAVVLYGKGVDKSLFQHKLKELKCDCLLLIYANDTHYYISVYNKELGGADSYIFRKGESVDFIGVVKKSIPAADDIEDGA